MVRSVEVLERNRELKMPILDLFSSPISWKLSMKWKQAKLKENSTEPSRSCLDCSDDDHSSNTSREEGLECPVCWESFNIVENVPHILWCGHTLCKNCVLGLQCADLKFSTQRMKLPFFVSCPWCYLLSFRLVYKGNLKFPSKNFFLLWMVESMNGNKVKYRDPALVSRSRTSNHSRDLCAEPNRNDRRGHVGRHYFSFHKSLDFLVRLTSKFHLVIVVLLIVFFAVPCSIVVLALYLLLTVLFAVPSLLVLYCTIPALQWLVQELTS